MGCLLGHGQMFIDVLYQFIFKGSFLLKRRLFRFFSAQVRFACTTVYTTFALKSCFSCEIKGVDQQISAALKVELHLIHLGV